MVDVFLMPLTLSERVNTLTPDISGKPATKAKAVDGFIGEAYNEIKSIRPVTDNLHALREVFILQLVGDIFGVAAVDSCIFARQFNYQVSQQAILLTELTVRLASDESEIPHRDPAEIAAALEDEDQAEGMKIIGDWPYDE